MKGCVSKVKETPGSSDLGSAVNQKFWWKSKPPELEPKLKSLFHIIQAHKAMLKGKSNWKRDFLPCSLC